MLLRKGLQKKGTIATLQVSSRVDLLAKVLFMNVEMYVTLPLKITNFVQLCRGNVILSYVELQNNLLKVEIS